MEAGMSSVLRVRRSPPLRGVCRVPGDKSISHRALLFGALADGVVEAEGLGQGGDNLSTAAALRALGVDIQLGDGRARIAGVGFQGLRAAADELDCGNSGTTIRLLLGLLAGRPFETRLRGDASLTRRPMGRVATPLRQMGARIDGRSDPARPNDIFPPLRIEGGNLTGIRYDLKVASAQLKSALILAALQARGPSELREPARSRDHTERMLGFMGAPISVDATGAIVVAPDGWNGRLRPTRLTIPGDLSSATFLIVAALIVPGSDVTVEGVGLNPTRAGALDALRAMGAELEVAVTGEAMGEPAGCVAPASTASWRCGPSTRSRRCRWRPPAPRAKRRSPTWPSCASRSRTASPRWPASSPAPAPPSPSAPTASPSPAWPPPLPRAAPSSPSTTTASPCPAPSSPSSPTTKPPSPPPTSPPPSPPSPRPSRPWAPRSKRRRGSRFARR